MNCSMVICEARERWPERLEMKGIWAAIQRKGHKNTAAAVSETLERAAAGLWKKWNREALDLYQRGWEYDGPTPKELIYEEAEHLRSRYGEGAAKAVTRDSIHSQQRG